MIATGVGFGRDGITPVGTAQAEVRALIQTVMEEFKQDRERFIVQVAAVLTEARRLTEQAELAEVSALCQSLLTFGCSLPTSLYPPCKRNLPPKPSHAEPYSSLDHNADTNAFRSPYPHSNR